MNRNKGASSQKWQQCFDHDSQRNYWRNVVTGETSWSSPVRPISRQPPSAWSKQHQAHSQKHSQGDTQGRNQARPPQQPPRPWRKQRQAPSQQHPPPCGTKGRNQAKSSQEQSGFQPLRVSMQGIDKENLNLQLPKINKALASRATLPSKLSQGIGDGVIRLRTDGQFVGQNVANPYRVKKMLERNNVEGWFQWLSGEIGWALSADKHRFNVYLRDLHEFYSSHLKQLRDKHKRGTPLRVSIDALYYKFGLEAKEVGQVIQNKELLWSKANKEGSLQEAVFKIRGFLEVLRFFCRDLQRRWNNIPWLANKKIGQQQWNRVKRAVFRVMRSSEEGPDVPVHWAAHPPLSSYPRSVVTNEVMEELVVALANILGNLFVEGFNANVHNLDQVSSFLATSNNVAAVTATLGQMKIAGHAVAKT